MYRALGQFVVRWWQGVLVAWLLAAGLLRFAAPAWDQVTKDGDFAYLPDRMSSVKAEALLDEAFPFERSRSQVVMIAARDDRKLSPDDWKVCDRLALFFQNALGAGRIKAGRQLQEQIAAAEQRQDLTEAARLKARQKELWEGAVAVLGEAIFSDANYADALHNRAIAHELLGQADDASTDRTAAFRLDQKLAGQPAETAPRGAEDLPLVAVWTRRSEYIGSKLRSRNGRAQLVVLQLQHEFTSSANLPVLEHVDEQLEKIRLQRDDMNASGLLLEVSGSAAVGADMLRSVRESLADTELYAILLVVGALLLIYRSPLLALIPLVTIATSLLIGMSIVASLTQIDAWCGVDGYSLQVFKTTKIYVVVILYGSGADFCLFLISRYREEMLRLRDHELAVVESMAHVGDALAASALTTICGLALMAVAEFGKFRNSGPVIALCLSVTWLAALTLAPALLAAFGRWIFWPWDLEADASAAGKLSPRTSAAQASQSEPLQAIWRFLASVVLARPGVVLTLGLLVLLPVAFFGCFVEVTYDLVSELDPQSASRQGREVLRKHFHVGESGPLVLLVRKEGAQFHELEGIDTIDDVTILLRSVPGVVAVRSLAEPLGDVPRGISLSSVEKIGMRKSRVIRSIFLAQRPELQATTARFELVLNHDPFSAEAFAVLRDVEAKLVEATGAGGPLRGAQLALTGTTAALRDLRDVTQQDTARIEVAVVIGVAVVLLVVLRQVYVSLAMLAAVLISVYATLAITEFFFRFAYGDTFQGIDWKVPLFLFVLLVAIGQDYNAYLATRVAEEQGRLGPRRGLQEGMIVTGNIISTCGLLMAVSFVSMTCSSLRGLVELGFALTLGVLLDTFFVRTILVPAALALLVGPDETDEEAILPESAAAAGSLEVVPDRSTEQGLTDAAE